MKVRLAEHTRGLLGALVALGISFAVAGAPCPSTPATASLSASKSASLAACPAPSLPPGTPVPTSVKQVDVGSTSGSGSIGAGGVTTQIGPALCQWVYDLPSQAGDPTVTFTYLGTVHMALSTSYAVSYSSLYGVSCNFHVEVLNGFGGGGAQETLNSGNCNTDTYVPGEGTVQVVGTGFHDGPVDTVASFGTGVTSFEAGYDVFYGTFTACSENPVGQMSTYNCDYFNGGPLF